VEEEVSQPGIQEECRLLPDVELDDGGVYVVNELDDGECML
jgi:hypothetical protein